MPIAPVDISARLKQAFSAKPLAAIAILHTLIEETFVLVERHMPEADTTEAKRRFAEVPRGLG